MTKAILRGHKALAEVYKMGETSLEYIHDRNIDHSKETACQS